MDNNNNSDYSRNRFNNNNNHNNDYLGVNKIGRNIRKSPLHQTSSYTNPARQPSQPSQPPQPQVYNINKNDFQSIVQQLTGSPLRQTQESLPRPTQNPPRPPSVRMQRSRPSPLTPLNVTRPRMPVHHAPPQEFMVPNRTENGVGSYNGGSVARPAYYGQHRPPPAMGAQPPVGDHAGWSNTAESPISAYMRYLQHSIVDSTQGPSQAHPQAQPHYQQNTQMQGQHQQQSSGLLPYPLLPSPRMNGPPPLPSPRMMNGGPPLPPLPSPRFNGPPPPLPSPTSQFLLASPSAYLNLLSPRSPYPLLSPGYQHPPPLTPNFSFSPMTQPGAFRGGPQPPPSPGMGFPSPGFFSISSPRWRD